MGSKSDATQQLRGVVYGKSMYAVPSGSLHLASQNVVLREDQKLESRRGIERLLRSNCHDKLFLFSDRLFAHQLDEDEASPGVGGVLNRFSADLTTVTSLGAMTNPATRKIQSAVAGGRLFLTTGQGLKVLDAAGESAFKPGGGPIAPSERGVPGVTATAGWLAAGFQAAYRYTLGRVAADGTQIIGPPSGRFIITNAGAGPFTTQPNVAIPPGLDETHFIQIWRSAQVANGTEPDDDLRLVYERQLSSLEVSQKFVLMEDVVPDALRGEYLYTNPNSGEGIQSANKPPPLAEEIVLHKNRLWLGRTSQPWSYSFKLLGVGGTNGIANLDRIIISSQNPALELTAGTDFTVVTAGSASQNVVDTAHSIVQGINTLASNTSIWAEYMSGPDDAVGEIRLFMRTATATEFQVFVDQRSGGAAWSSRAAYAPEMLPYLAGLATPITFSLQRAANVVTATINSGNLTNALRVGDTVYCTNPSGSFSSAAAHVVTAIAATTFQYAEVAGNAGPTAGFVFQISGQNARQATQDSFVNRIHFSKPYEFEAFPEQNYVDLGASDKGIIAMRATRETLWVFKEDGLFRITGDDETTFDQERVDATIIALSPECVQPFAEAVVAWTTRGVVLLSESSFDIISDDIGPLLKDYLADDQARATSLIPQCFMVVDHHEGLLRLHLAGASVDNGVNTAGAGEALVYALNTKTWSRWTYPAKASGVAPKDLRHGIWNPAIRRVFYVDGYYNVAGEGFLWRERSYAAANTYADDDNLNPSGAATPFAITGRALWVAQVGKAPMLDKRFDEVTILFAKPSLPAGTIVNPGAFSYGFGNENNEQGDSIAMFGLAVAVKVPSISVNPSETPAGPAVRILPPVDVQRGQRLWIRIDHATIEEFTINGFSVLAEVLNASIGR